MLTISCEKREKIVYFHEGKTQMYTHSLGADLRSQHNSCKMTLEEMAQDLGKSVGWLGQIKRDISTPRMSDLQRISKLFFVPLSLFFGKHDGPEIEHGTIVRKSGRGAIGESKDGPAEAPLSPVLTDYFEVVHSTFPPGSSRRAPIRRNTHELAYMASGKLNIWIEDDCS